MATGVKVWSQTAASNASSDSAINWAEGQAPSSVNDSARGMMASVSKWRDDLNGTVVTSGTSTAYTVSSNQGLALTAGHEITFQVNADCGATVTLAVDSLGAKPLRAFPGVELVAGALKNGGIYRATYATSNSGEWLLQNVTPTIIAANQVVTASITDANVTYAKIQNETNNTLLGNVSGSAAPPEEITIGAGLKVTSTTLSAPAFPPSGAFKNLSIKVATNTTVTVAADFVTTTDGTNYQTTAVSSIVNLGTNGGVDALEGSLSIAIDTWYALWVIAKADGTTKVLANTSATAVTFPSGYTYKARIGWVRTIHGSATLYGTWQLGRDAQYILGLAQTAIIPLVANGPAGTYSNSAPVYASLSISNFAPPTAGRFRGIVTAQYGTGSQLSVLVAPNSGYSGPQTTTAPPVSNANTAVGGPSAISFDFMLESSNIYWASSGTGGAILAFGWVDNI